MECGELGSNQASQYAEIYNNAVVKSFALVNRVELSSYPTATATILWHFSLHQGWYGHFWAGIGS